MKRVKNFFSEFKSFITKGNIMDLAVAVIIGAAFNKIVSSLVADLITPLIAAATGSATMADLSVTIGTAQLNWGKFVQTVIDFLVIGFVVFLMVKSLNKAKALAAKMNDKVEDAAKDIVSKIKKENGKETAAEAEIKIETEEPAGADAGAAAKITGIEENIGGTAAEINGTSEQGTPQADILSAPAPTVEELLKEIRDLLKNSAT